MTRNLHGAECICLKCTLLSLSWCNCNFNENAIPKYKQLIIPLLENEIMYTKITSKQLMCSDVAFSERSKVQFNCKQKVVSHCVVTSVTISTYKRCSVRLYLKLFVGGVMSYLRSLYLFAHSDVNHILCVVFLFLVFPLLPVSLDCPFLIASLSFL